MLEIELTFLAKEIPVGLLECQSKKVIDIYLPNAIKEHAPIRIRKSGDVCEITKKHRLKEDDGSQLVEQTIKLTQNEFSLLEKEIVGRRIEKTRYYYNYGGRTAEIDVFEKGLLGLVIVEFEFDNEKELRDFEMPSFCLANVTQANFTRGGMLCGKNYAEIELELTKYGYKKLVLK